MNISPNVFKAYDIRGLVDSEIDSDFAFETGVAFARFLQIEREPATVVIGEDMRPSSPLLAEAFSAGVTSQGMDVIRIGLASTDLMYFASGKLGLPGAMFTASHNPAEYNGIKLCLSQARPIGRESGLLTIEKFVREGGDYHSQPMIMVKADEESITPKDLFEYLKHKYKMGDDFIKQVIRDWVHGEITDDFRLSKNVALN
jgi:phosphomannomutase